MLILRSILVLALIAMGARADIKPKPLAKGSSALTMVDPARGSVPVTMLWEKVDLYPRQGQLFVRAVFGLRNTSDQRVAFEVGFPSYFEKSLQEFKALVDGAPQRFELKRTERQGRRKPVFVYWLCWNLAFAPGQEREVTVEYRVDTYPNRILRHNQHLPNSLRKVLFWNETGYVLRTGADWKGPIGRAEITVHFSDDVPSTAATLARPRKGWKLDAKTRTARVVLENFEPNAGSDVRLYYRSKPPKEEYAMLRDLHAKQSLRASVWTWMLSLVEDPRNPLELDDQERSDQVLSVLASAISLREDAPWHRVSRLDRRRYHAGFDKWVRELTRLGRRAEALAVARSWLRFQKAVVKKDERWKDAAGRRGQAYAELLAQQEKIEALIKTLGG